MPSTPVDFADVPSSPMPLVDLPSTPTSKKPLAEASVPNNPAAKFVLEVLWNAVELVRPVPRALEEAKPGPDPEFLSVTQGDEPEHDVFGSSAPAACAGACDMSTAPATATQPIRSALNVARSNARVDTWATLLRTGLGPVQSEVEQAQLYDV